jgi:hypothetical protein
MSNRFKNIESHEIEQILNNAIPDNTKKATKFAMKIFDGK